ncbi:MAG: DNA polymerase III subunit gamma and tau, partial [Actinomycetes bacterium]
GGSDEIVREALIRVLGVDWKVEAIVDPSAAPAGAPARDPGPARSTPPVAGRSGLPAGGAGAPAGSPPAEPAPRGRPAGDHGVPSVDDEDADDTGLSHQDLLARELGARVIGEYDNG